jgi:hypothetical protein
LKPTEEEMKSILTEFLRIISHIQDLEYQTRVWIRREGPECQAFDDAVCDFFDIGDSVLDAYKDYGITDSQHDLLMRFRNEYEAFSDENTWPENFIDTPEWAKIMEMAKEILEAFHYQKDLDQDTKNGTAQD